MGLPQKQILRQGHEWVQCHKEVISGSIEGSGDVRRKERRQQFANGQLATVGNWSGALLGTPGREHRACIRTVLLGAKSWAVYSPNPIHWGWGWRWGAWEGVLPGASAPSSVFPSHWPSGKALRWNTAGDYRRKLSACTRMVNAPEGIHTVRAPDSFCYCYSSKMFSLLTL